MILYRDELAVAYAEDAMELLRRLNVQIVHLERESDRVCILSMLNYLEKLRDDLDHGKVRA